MTDKEFELVPSVKDFYLIKLNNPSDCTLHPMIILDKKDDKFLVSIGTEVTLDSNIDESLIHDLIDAIYLYKENDMIDFLWQSSTNSFENASAIIVEFNNINQAKISGPYIGGEDFIFDIEVVSKWNLNTYREAF